MVKNVAHGILFVLDELLCMFEVTGVKYALGLKPCVLNIGLVPIHAQQSTLAMHHLLRRTFTGNVIQMDIVIVT